MGALLVVFFSVLALGGSVVGGSAAAERHGFVIPHLASGRVDSRLADLLRAAKREGVAAALGSARTAGLRVSGGRVRVVVVARRSGAAAASAVAAAGGRVAMRAGGLVEALLAPSALALVARSSAVAEVRSPDLAVTQAVDEGVALSGADVWHGAGIDGSGVKVGIVDEGFAGYAALLGTALPASVTTDDRCGGNLATPVAQGGSDHGTAVAELVHQMAPGAQLYLICVDSEVGLALAEQDAAGYGVRVINESLAWFGPNVGRGDGSGGAGSPDAVVAQARADGILWVNASGNYAQDHWSGSFVPDPSDPALNDFSSGVPYDQVTIASGEQACVVLTWDDWPVTTEDFDLGLFRESDGALVADSVNDQSSGLLAPEEDLCYTNTGATGTFDIAIADYNVVGSPHLDLVYTGASSLAYGNGDGSVVDPASSPDALAVGAACWNGPQVEPYSSYGPTIDGRTKPDLIAADRVSTVTYGDSNGDCFGTSGFAGTSAAAPQVAGAAALFLQQQPGLSAAGLTAKLEARARAGAAANSESQTRGNGLLTMGPLAPLGEIATSGSEGVGVVDGSQYQVVDGNAMDPEWSADGARINVEVPNGGLGSIAPDGSGLQTITGSPIGVWQPDWSPDGSRVAYYVPPNGISVFNIASQTASQILSDSTARNPTWSPDGSEIAYASSAGGSPDVWLMNADGSGAHQLTTLGDVNDGNAEGHALTWSPDGSKIAFSAGGNPGQIWTVNADGSNPQQLTNDGVDPVWSPDGARIAFMTWNNGNWVIEAVNSDGTNEQTIYGGQGWVYPPQWLAWTSATILHAFSPPSLSGTSQVGQALAASIGNWQSTSALTFAYQWYRCDSGGANCSAVTGATDESYHATNADVGSTLRVEVDVSDGAASASARSAPSQAVIPAPPLPTAIPTVGGTAEQGMTLKITSPGAWSAPVSLHYQWLNCASDGSDCYAISGATSSTYSPTSDDIGDTIRVAVWAVGAGGTSYLSSTPTVVVTAAPVPTMSAEPAIAGTAAVGHTLTATSGSWTSLIPLTGYSYQWQRCDTSGTACVTISGATVSTYTLTAADAGATMRVAVAAKNASGSSIPALSNPSSVVVGIPSSQASPTVSGTAAVGKSLSATRGSWNWNPTGYGYQWQRCSAAGHSCTTISGATNASYLVAAADAGQRLVVIVSATNLAGTGTSTSGLTATVVARPSVRHAPSIGGKAKVGRRLSARRGAWSGPPAQYRYHWLRCSRTGRACRTIPAAIHSTYHLSRRDAGHRLRLRVTAINAAGTATATSAATRLVKR